MGVVYRGIRWRCVFAQQIAGVPRKLLPSSRRHLLYMFVLGKWPASGTSYGFTAASHQLGNSVNRCQVPDRVHQQIYLCPYSQELMLRNHF